MDGAFWNAELETKPWAEIEAWQASRIADFVALLPARSAFYRSHLGTVPSTATDIRSFAELEAMPFTTKEQLRQAQSRSEPGQPFGTNQAAPLVEIVQAVSSSGTTGDPMFYALTRRDLDVWSDGIANVFFTCGIRPDDVVAHLVGLPMVAGGLPYADGFRRIGATLAWLGGLPTERILRALPKLQASALLATTSFGVYLSDHCRDLIGCMPSELHIRKYLSGGEPGLGQPEIRRKISAGWGTEHIRECMGIGDVMSALWGECEAGDGMHFSGQRSIALELVDPATGARLPWRDGAEGEAVYTTFKREATPVLRYRSADHVVVTSTSCACGRTSPKIRCIGRTDDMLIYKAMNVFPSAIRDVVLSRFAESVEPYMRIWKDYAGQVRFDDPIPVDIEHRADADPARLATLGREIEAEVRHRLQVRIAVCLVTPRTIPRSVYKSALVQVRPEPPEED